MMCNTCKKAGDYLSRGLVGNAIAQHKKCEYKDCTCHHDVVSVLTDSQTTGRPSS